MPRVVRVICLAITVNTFGGALSASAIVLFLVYAKGFEPATVAALMLVSASGGLALAGILGWLGDRFGKREMLQLYLVGMAMATGALLLVETTWQLALALGTFYVLDRGVSGIAAGLIATTVEPDARAETRGLTRTYGLLGTSLGFFAAVPLITLDRDWALALAIGIDAATFVVAVGVYQALPTMAPRSDGSVAERRPHAFTAMLDWRFLLSSVLICAPAVVFPLLTFGMPTWVPTTEVPVALLPILLLGTNLLMLFIQVPVSRKVKTARQARRATVLGSAACAVAFVLLWAVPSVEIGVGVALVAVATAIFAGMRAMLTAAQFTMAYVAAREDAQSQYQSVFGTVLAVIMAAGPMAYSLALGVGDVGWLVLAGIVLASGTLATIAVPTSPTSSRPISMSWPKRWSDSGLSNSRPGDHRPDHRRRQQAANGRPDKDPTTE